MDVDLWMYQPGLVNEILDVFILILLTQVYDVIVFFSQLDTMVIYLLGVEVFLSLPGTPLTVFKHLFLTQVV